MYPATRSHLPLLSCLALAVLICFGGCAREEKLIPVSGKVTFADGKPLTSGTVTFKPDKSKGNNFGGEPIGEIDSNGEYSLQTRGKPGAPAGAYKVLISATAGLNTSDNTKISTKKLVNTKFLAVDTTPLEKTVAANAASGAYDLQVTP